MTRYVALLRGVSPLNARMPALKASFEAAGFQDVRTLLSSGNVAFSTRAAPPATLARRAESAMQDAMGRTFATQVRAQKHLQDLVAADPFAAFELPAAAKRVVTFLGDAVPDSLPLPPERAGARILAVRGTEVLSAYLPSADGPVFMALIERTFGKAVTTRTWDTVRKCAVA
ncbi:DUF1697 domain-containing protein [Ideonella sp.]|uniref:DUF1697 domain-containing protein n=1 Tax=Ideonella sp. TaxID=1929293 RepID=UPI0035B0E2C2